MGAASATPRLRLTLLGVGAMNSPRYPPAGLLVRYRRRQIMLDGGPGAEPAGRLAAWLVSDERSELRRELRALCAARGLLPSVAAVSIADLVIEPHPVAHTSHPTWGTCCACRRRRPHGHRSSGPSLPGQHLPAPAAPVTGYAVASSTGVITGGAGPGPAVSPAAVVLAAAAAASALGAGYFLLRPSSKGPLEPPPATPPDRSPPPIWPPGPGGQ